MESCGSVAFRLSCTPYLWHLGFFVLFFLQCVHLLYCHPLFSVVVLTLHMSGLFLWQNLSQFIAFVYELFSDVGVIDPKHNPISNHLVTVIVCTVLDKKF